MGYFSYFCQRCDKPIVHGEGVKLWLLQKGKIIEEKEGNYNSYGNVDEEPNWINDWGEIVDLHFGNKCDDGIAAIHTECWDTTFKGVPTEKSEDDPNQGSGTLKKSKSIKHNSVFYSNINSDFYKEKIKKDSELSDRLTSVIEKTERLLKKLGKNIK